MKQVTFMMLKPDAFAGHHVQQICMDLENHGLHIEKKQS